MSIKDDIINYLEKNKLSTEEIGDILGKTGVVKNIYPIISGKYIVGEIQYFYAYSNSNWPIHEQLINLKPNRIAFFDSIFVEDYALFGELVSTFILDKKKAKAIVVNGLMRDLNGIKQRGYPVWCKGITPIGCFNISVNKNAEITRRAQKALDYYSGSIAVCDDSGVVVIPKEEINEKFIDKMQKMSNQEKIWFDCVENKNWNTYDTVCLKKYLEEKNE